MDWIRCLSTLLLTVALAGCITDPGATSSSDEDGTAAPQEGMGSEERAPYVKEWDGGFTAVGTCEEGVPGAAAGTFYLPEPVPVGANATSLAVEVDWQDAATRVCLGVTSPDGQATLVHNEPTAVTGSVLQVEIAHPVPGTWNFFVRTTGGGAATYHATATVTY